jgi:diaminopimelate epimerase
MDSLPFTKMEGCGNDFVVVYRHALPPGAGPSLAPILCDRSTGVGADGMLVVDFGPSLADTDKAEGALARMTVWNADGSIAEMCGNGLRCVVRRLAEDVHLGAGPALASGSAKIQTGAGLMPVKLLGDTIQVAAGRPQLPEEETVRTVVWEGHTLRGLVVSMGNPHFVLFDSDLPDGLPDLTTWGPDVEIDAAFPERTNVEWVRLDKDVPQRLQMRVWERGVGETQACGSGACASAVAARVLGYCQDGTIEVALPGGVLQVDWSGREGDLAYIKGPATTVFAGQWKGKL